MLAKQTKNYSITRQFSGTETINNAWPITRTVGIISFLLIPAGRQVSGGQQLMRSENKITEMYQLVQSLCSRVKTTK
jgi:hypothetical protein